MIYPHQTPLLAPTSPLDSAQRRFVAQLHELESARQGTGPIDEAINPVRLQKLEFTRSEILAQPAYIEATWKSQADAMDDVVARLGRTPPERLYLIGCDDSVAVMLAARPLLEEMFGVACEPIQALEFAYYANRPVGPGTLVVGLSSSGETLATLEGMILAKALGAQTLAMTNTAGSSMAKVADLTLLIEAQRRGWPTQSTTAALALLYALALRYGRAQGVAAIRIDELETALWAIPGQITQAIAAHEIDLQAIAKAESRRQLYVFSGAGPTFSCAVLGAIKVEECTPDRAMAIPLEEERHYTSFKAGDPLFLITPNGLSERRALQTASDARRHGATVYVVAADNNDAFDAVSSVVIRLPAMIERLSPLVYTIPGQLFAYHLAMAKFALADGTPF